MQRPPHNKGSFKICPVVRQGPCSEFADGSTRRGLPHRCGCPAVRQRHAVAHAHSSLLTRCTPYPLAAPIPTPPAQCPRQHCSLAPSVLAPRCGRGMWLLYAHLFLVVVENCVLSQFQLPPIIGDVTEMLLDESRGVLAIKRETSLRHGFHGCPVQDVLEK